MWCLCVGRSVCVCVCVCVVCARLCFCVCVKDRERERERETERERDGDRERRPSPQTHHTTHQPFRRASPPPTPLPSASLPPPPPPSFSLQPPDPPASLRPLPLPLLLQQPPFECPNKSVTKSVLLQCPPGKRKRAFSVLQVGLHCSQGHWEKLQDGFPTSIISIPQNHTVLLLRTHTN